MPDPKVTFQITAQDKASATLKRLKGEVNTLGGAAARTAGPMGKLSAATGGLISPTALALGGIGLLTAGLAGAARELIDIERLNAQTAAALRSTGGAAKTTLPEIEALAEGLERTTTTERQTVQEGANLLLTFKRIRNEVGEGNDVFDRATRTALDLSVALGTDMHSASMMLGKALDDPIRGMTALRRAGVALTEQQAEQVRAFVASGDILQAQTLILRELETQVGGSAEAFASTTAGKIERFENDVSNAFESIIVGAVKVSDFLGQEVDLWPFDGPKLATEAGITAQQTIDSYANTIYGGGTGGPTAVADAAQFAITDPLFAEMLAAEENANKSGHQVVIEYAAGLLTPQTDVEKAIAAALQVAEDEMSRVEEFAYLSGQTTILEEARGLASAAGKTASVIAIDAAMAVIQERIDALSAKAYTSGYGVVTEYAKGMWAGIWQISDAANELASKVRYTAGIDSEPEDPNSPLRGITKWGGNLVKTYAKGMLRELGSMRTASTAMAGQMGGMMVGAGSGGAGGGGGLTVNFNSAFPPTPGQAQSVVRAMLPEFRREQRRQGF